LNTKDFTCTLHGKPYKNHNLAKERGKNSVYVTKVEYYHNNIAKEVLCQYAPNLTLIATMEPMSNFLHVKKFTDYFDGHSTTHPDSTITRTYYHPFKENQFFSPFRKFSELIKGASFVSSNCDYLRGAIVRNNIIGLLRKHGFRVDGLGKCMHTPVGPEGVELNYVRTSNDKISAISRYMFNMAFENTVEPGYVTEKPFEALTAGTVPVYFGHDESLKSLIPDPKGAIYLSDFGYNITKLANYLLYLTTNEAAYEIHRAWRSNYSYKVEVKRNRKFQTSFVCEICEWAMKAVRNPTKGCLENYTPIRFLSHRRQFNASDVDFMKPYVE